MPRYTYQCGECAHQVETVHSMETSLGLECPSCGALAFERLIFAPAISVRGEDSLNLPGTPVVGTDAQIHAMNRAEQREFKAARDRAKRLHRQENKQGHRSSFRHVGSLPMSERNAIVQTMGEEALQGDNLKDTLKRAGRFFGND